MKKNFWGEWGEMAFSEARLKDEGIH